jgi:hypothetical protein
VLLSFKLSHSCLLSVTSVVLVFIIKLFLGVLETILLIVLVISLSVLDIHPLVLFLIAYTCGKYESIISLSLVVLLPPSRLDVVLMDVCCKFLTLPQHDFMQV